MDSAARVAKVVEAEEKQFDRVLKIRADAAGMKRLKSETSPASKAFHLYETFGLPLDFMVDAARDAGVTFDMKGFEARERRSRRARALRGRAAAQKTASPAFRDLPKTVFEGYRQLTSTNCEVLAIVKGGVGVPAAKAGDEVEVVLDHTSFYGDSGGQVGDTGVFLTVDGNSVGGRNCRLRAAGAGRAGAQGGAEAGSCGGRSREYAWWMESGATRSGATIRGRICCTRRCGRCWARM